jgi:hypothetical protein
MENKMKNSQIVNVQLSDTIVVQAVAYLWALSFSTKPLAVRINSYWDQYHFEEAGHFMESLLSLRCEYVQTLLETCSSIKAKRLFLYFAHTYNMPWFKKLDIKKLTWERGNAC